MPTAQLSALDPISSWSAIAFSAVLIAVVLTPIRNRPRHEVTRTAVGLTRAGAASRAGAGMRMRDVQQRRPEHTLDLAHRHGIYLRPGRFYARAQDWSSRGTRSSFIARPSRTSSSSQALADPLGDHQALQVADVADRPAVHGDDQVLGPQAGPCGGAAVDDLHDLDAELAPDP